MFHVLYLIAFFQNSVNIYKNVTEKTAATNHIPNKQVRVRKINGVNIDVSKSTTNFTHISTLTMTHKHKLLK